MKKMQILFLVLLFILTRNIFSQNLLTNGDFESDFDEWENIATDNSVATFILESSDVYGGSGAMKLEISSLGTSDWSIQSMHSGWPSVAGTMYKLTLYGKSETGTSIRAVQQLNEYAAQDFSLSSSWAKYEWIFQAQENNQQLKFHFYDDGIIYLDNISIEEYSNTYPSENTLTINTNTRYQTMQGFGGAIAFYEGWIYAHPNKEEIYQLLWEDMGINLLRLRNSYRYETNFTSDVSEFTQKAEEYSDKDVRILMCSWSPPASLKSNGNENNGTLAKINGEFVYQEFADYWRDALIAYRKIGVEPDWIGIQNEPDYLTDSWETCKFTPTETDEFPGYDVALKYVNNTISTLDNPPLLLGAEELGIGYNNFNSYSDPIKSAPWLWAYGYHLYHGGDPELPDSYNSSFQNIAQNYSDHPNIMTEYEHFEAGWFKTAWLISNNISVGNASAYFYWNLVWPGSGLISIDNPWDLANWSNDKGYTINPHFYAFKHFSKFVDVGCQRVECINTNEGIKSSVFISKEGTELVMVLLNVTDHSVSTNVIPAGWESESSQIYQSVEGNYFQYLGEVTSAGTMNLPPQSITTIVLGSDIAVIEPESVSLTPTTLTLHEGSSSLLTATVLPENATNKNVIWTSSNTAVATVNSNGLVTAIAEGNTDIIVTTETGSLTAVCSVIVLPVAEEEFILTINSSAGGSVQPAGGSYPVGTEITITAIPDDGFIFINWSGDISGESATITLIMDSDKTIYATFQANQNEHCENPVSISVPFSQNGAGEYCWVTTNDIAYVNSWNMLLLEINGVDFTNKWSSSFPPKVEGNYYIRYNGLYPWSHFEAAGLKAAGITKSELPDVVISPNPFEHIAVLSFENIESVHEISIYDFTGKFILKYNKSRIYSGIEIGSELSSGLYILKVSTENQVISYLIKKK